MRVTVHAAERSNRCCEAFAPDALRAWIHGLGIETFVGSSGRVFPTDMKAAPLLRAWLHRLREAGVRFHVRHRWCGWDADRCAAFRDPAGNAVNQGRRGGAGAWRRQLGEAGIGWRVGAAAGKARVQVAPCCLRTAASMCGWSEHFRTRFAGQPVKTGGAAVSPMPPDARIIARASSWCRTPAWRAA